MGQDPRARRTGGWARSTARWWLGLALAVVGAALLWLGWYQVSGETLVARQLPYLVSATIPGAALVVAGAVLIGSEISRRGSQQAEEMVAALHGLLTEETPVGSAGGPVPDAEARVVAVPDGTRYHRPGCPLVEGKPDVRAVGAGEVRRLGMQACPVCSPMLPGD